MAITYPQWRRVFELALRAVPVAGLMLNATSWVRYGIDLPFLDDFRVFEREKALSLDPADLFTPSNDTLYPVGMALDALAQRYLDGNTVAYQVLSMAGVLGGLLWLQWRLLSAALADPLVASAAFAMCVFMVQPGSYWGLHNLAYHQGLPVLFLFAAVAIILDRRWAAWWGVPSVFVLGLLAGFSYISGAFSAFAVALALTVLGCFRHLRSVPLLRGGLSLLTAAAIACTAQGGMILTVQNGRLYDPRNPWTFPWDGDFWAFIFGRVGAALRLDPAHPRLSLAVVIALFVIAIGLVVILLRRTASDISSAAESTRTTAVLVTLSAGIMAYLLLLAGARTSLITSSVEASPLFIFTVALQNNFHFFWVTPLLPWIFAGVYVAARNKAPGITAQTTSTIVALTIVGYAAAAGAFSHARYYRDLQAMRLNTDVRCLQDALARGGEIRCERLTPGDFRPVMAYARRIGASFTRHYPP